MSAAPAPAYLARRSAAVGECLILTSRPKCSYRNNFFGHCVLGTTSMRYVVYESPSQVLS
jgi:hypothetical protein